MKYIKIALVIVIIIALAFVSYQGYLAYQNWQQTRKSRDQLLIESLKANEGMIIKLSTKLSDIEMRIVNDNIKTTVEVKPDYTYEALKDEVIELKQDEEANKEEIEKLREELSAQRKAFLASDDTILIKTIDDDTLLIYRDEKGTLQPASANIDKIIEHRELSSVIPVLIEEKIATRKTKYNLKAGAYYSLNKTYGVCISKGIFSIWDYSLNASLLISDFENVKLAVGGDIDYSLSNDFLLGVGYSTDNQYYIKLQYSF